MIPHRLNLLFLLSISLGLLGFGCQKSPTATVKTSNDSQRDKDPGKDGKDGVPGVKAPVAPAREATAKLADESYQCPRLVHDRATGQPIVKMDQYVDFRLSKGTIHTRIHIAEASADLTFEQCRNLPRDGSDFARWFIIECTKFQGLDGGPFSIDAFLVNAYAGISPVIDSTYAKYPQLVEVGKRTGRGTPKRTIVFYADKKVMMEFLCYP